MGVMSWAFIKMIKQMIYGGKLVKIAALFIFGVLVYNVRMLDLPSLSFRFQPRHDAIGGARTTFFHNGDGPANDKVRDTHAERATAHVREHYAICMESGRLGNNMFTFASVYGIAKRNNLTVAIDINNELLKYFKLDAKRVKIGQMSDYKVLEETRASDFNAELTTFEKHKDVHIKRYLQSWRYFIDVENVIHAQFDFSERIKMAADQIISKIREEQSHTNNASVTIVGIHYRHGDFAQKDRQEFGYQTAPVEYVTRAMTYFRLLLLHRENVIFVVASNNIPYGKQFLNGKGVVFLERNPAIIDMAVLARCEHLIITVGSFGWWAGFLNKGTVLYYKYPAREGSRLRTQYGKTYTNYFYPTWVGMT